MIFVRALLIESLRSQILMYVLDTAGTEGRDPISDFKHLQHELELYAPDITTRPSLIIANKMDEAGAEKNLHKLRKATDLAVLPVRYGNRGPQ